MIIVKKFSDFKIKPVETKFTGEKIKIEKILNKIIRVEYFKIIDSKFKGKCLCIQIIYSDEKRLIFTGSKALQQQIEQIPEDGFPFTTTIVKDEHYEFS